MAKCLCQAAKQVLDELQNYNIMHIDGITGRGCVRNRDLVQAERNYEKYRSKCKCRPFESYNNRDRLGSPTKPKAEKGEESDFEEDIYGSPEGDSLDGLLTTTGLASTQCDRCKYAADQLFLGRITSRAQEIMKSVTSLCQFCTKRSENSKLCHCTEQFFTCSPSNRVRKNEKWEWKVILIWYLSF